MTGTLAVVILLVGAGLCFVIYNGQKLISDWPRPKPVHNVDVAWVQVYLGLALLVAAWFIATDPARKLIEPTPVAVNPETAAVQQDSQAPKKGQPPNPGQGR